MATKDDHGGRYTERKALRYDSNGNLRETMNERDKPRNERD